MFVYLKLKVDRKLIYKNHYGWWYLWCFYGSISESLWTQIRIQPDLPKNRIKWEFNQFCIYIIIRVKTTFLRSVSIRLTNLGKSSTLFHKQKPGSSLLSLVEILSLCFLPARVTPQPCRNLSLRFLPARVRATVISGEVTNPWVAGLASFLPVKFLHNKTVKSCITLVTVIFLVFPRYGEIAGQIWCILGVFMNYSLLSGNVRNNLKNVYLYTFLLQNHMFCNKK